jgi:hypothetical protein
VRTVLKGVAFLLIYGALAGVVALLLMIGMLFFAMRNIDYGIVESKPPRDVRYDRFVCEQVRKGALLANPKLLCLETTDNNGGDQQTFNPQAVGENK